MGVEIRSRDESVKYALDRLHQLCPSLTEAFPEINGALSVLFTEVYLDGQIYETKQTVDRIENIRGERSGGI
jgi:D-serine dehydratase